MSDDINITVSEEAISVAIEDNTVTPSHNNLSGLDEGDYQHLTQAEHDTLLGGVDASTLHNHDGRYYTESEMDTSLAGKSDTGHTHAHNDLTSLDTGDYQHLTQAEHDTLIGGSDVNAASLHTHNTLPQILNYAEDVNALGSISSNTALDFADGSIQTMTIEADLTLSFTNWPSATKVCSMVLEITNGGAHTVTWPAAVKWVGGNAPSLTAAGTDFITLLSYDNGTTIYGFESGMDMK